MHEHPGQDPFKDALCKSGGVVGSAGGEDTGRESASARRDRETIQHSTRDVSLRTDQRITIQRLQKIAQLNEHVSAQVNPSSATC